MAIFPHEGFGDLSLMNLHSNELALKDKTTIFQILFLNLKTWGRWRQMAP